VAVLAQRGHLSEGRRRLEELLALPSAQGRDPARARALAAAGGIAWWQEDIAAARGFYREALAIERELGVQRGIAEALYNQAFVAAADGDFEGAFRGSRRAWSCSGGPGTRPGRPGPTG